MKIRRILQGLILLIIVLLTSKPALALSIKLSGEMRARAFVQGEFDGRKAWEAQKMGYAVGTDRAALTAPATHWLRQSWFWSQRQGSYSPYHIYDRGSHFLGIGPGGEDNPTGIDPFSGAPYICFQDPNYAAPGSTGAGVQVAPPYVTHIWQTAGAGANTLIGPDMWQLMPNSWYAPATPDAGNRGAHELIDDENVFLDQRLRIWITVEIMEGLRQVTALEIGDSVWGLANQGADWGADDVALDVMQAYLDFSVPMLPFANNFKVGVLPFMMHRSWLLDIDAAGVLAQAGFEPVTLGIAYIRALESAANVFNPEDRSDNVDIYGAFAGLSIQNFQATATIMLQDGPSSTFTSPDSAKWGGAEEFGNTIHWYALDLDYTAESFRVYFTGIMNGGTNDYYRLDDRNTDGSTVPLGNLKPLAADYNGYMFDLGADLSWGAFTLMLEGFCVSGDEFKDFGYDGNDFAVTQTVPGDNIIPGGGTPRDNFFYYQDSNDEIDRFVYPHANSVWNPGAEHYWSEILGAGTLDQNSVGGGSLIGSGSFGQWQGGTAPYNVWAIKIGGAYKVSDNTSLSFFYWYVATAENVVSTVDESNTLSYGNVIATDDSIGHEIDLYVDQVIYGSLTLRLVAAYLIADDAFSIWDDDQDAYEYGMRLRVTF